MRAEAQRQSALSPEGTGQALAVQNVEPEAGAALGGSETELQCGSPSAPPTPRRRVCP